ncbi:rhomboid family intramembrane serine protease [Saccharothrix coeruleofusca]|uniref:Rhomboid family intramembrane serine protease n=1 Tax=Saccharothrix coeruleofusca TaxID=33919 RepID=A0A918ECT1_9PSEU|nr:rhomboid family intramembrane serine protease [Saccharothrix coeruleofusca]MBP2339972.1 membrane associated rhomboid family serine protease [Saccharothrix coeruleofusca]GGP38240.1 rhomboid family intramembrane serine protease [Saccharothrix coeruleofusca]
MASSPTPPPPGDPIGAQPDRQVCVRHPGRVTALRCSRCDRPSCPDCLREASVGHQCVDCVMEGNRTTRTARTVAGAEDNPRRMVVAPVLIALNAVAFLVTAGQAGSAVDLRGSQLYADFVMWPIGVYFGEWWRLVASGFLHNDPLHLLLNMAALYVLGQLLEPVFGRTRFLAVYLLSLLGGSVAVYLFDSVDRPVAGASGAIYGLLGALLVTQLKLRANLTPVLMVLGVNVVFSFTVANISWLGHLGGLFVGAAMAAALVYAPKPGRVFWQAGAVVAALLVLVLLVVTRTALLG